MCLATDPPELMRYVHLLDYVKPEGVVFLAGVMHDPEKKRALQLLNEGGIRNIEMSSLNILLESPDEREQVIAGIQELTHIFPRFSYTVREFTSYLVDADAGERRRVLDPYFILFDSMQHNTLSELWSTPPFDTTQLPARYTNALMRSLRMTDNTLSGSNVGRYDIDPTQLQQFHNAIEQLRAVSMQYKDIPAFQEILNNRATLLLIARQPRRVAELVDLPTAVPELFRLLAPGGPLHANLSGTIGSLFENGNIIRRAKELTTVFTKKLPLWSTLFLYTDMRLGGTLASTDSAFPVEDVVGLSIRTMRQHHLRMKSEHPDAPTSLEHAIADEQVREQVLSGAIEVVPVSSLSGVFKRLVFREMIQQTVERSRDDARKHQADRRNRTLAQPQLTFDRPTGIHGTRSVDVLPSILLNGNLPQESLGEGASTDSRPFHFDFFLVQHPEKTGRAEDAGLTTMDAVLKGTNLNSYFNEQGIALLYDRSGAEAYQHDKEVPGTAQGAQHFMIFGGMPATEVRGIVCRSQEQVPKITHAILEAGFYIPVYTVDGALQFSADQYDALREEWNMAVPVTVWDTSMKTGEQLGSNAGGEYTAPAREGPVRYYVKFSSREGAGDRLWNEQLADNMYRAMGIAVPETEVVRIGNDYGHASRIFEKQEGPMVDFKDGFIVDAWLANWDVVFERNRAEHDGRTVRLDNGGSLLYRAQGERRTTFGPVVGELDTMRASYVGLTDEEVRSQALQLQRRMTDEAIDRLVDGVRLPMAERDGLKQALKDRRDYIVEEVFAAEAEAIDEDPIPAPASEVIALFESQQRDHSAIGARISEWNRLMSEEGYQHNGVLLGKHLMDAIDVLRATSEFSGLTPKEQQLAVVATLFHDIGKPTGRREERVERDFGHEIPSIAIARQYMDAWGMSNADQRVVSLAIQYDGVVSDIARGKVRDDSKNMTPAQLRAALKANERAIRVLRAVNRADVVATVGEGAYAGISESFERFFDQMQEVIEG